MKNKWLVFTCGCLLALLSSLSLAQATAGPPSRVLFIASYHPGFPTFFDQVEGLESELKSPAVKLDIEFMDAKRFDNQQAENLFFANLERKLEQLPAYDLIISADDAATHFVVDHHQQLFAKAPVVFFGVNDLAFAQSLNKLPFITGIAERAAYRDTVKLINKLFPGGEIYIITDNNISARMDSERFIREFQQDNFTNYQLLSLADLSFDELRQRVQKITLPSVLLISSMYHDKSGTNLDFEHSLMEIHQAAQVPIFHLWPHGLGQGIIGGKLLSQKVQAKIAAKMGLKILRGDNPKNIPVIMDPPTEYRFDYRELERFGLAPADLPAGSELINAPDPAYLRYRNYIIASAVFLALLIIALLVLLMQYRNRRNFEKKLLLINSHLELKVKARTAELATANQEMKSLLQLRDSILDNSLVSIVLTKNRVIQWINSYAESMFGYSAEEVIGRDTQFIYSREQDYQRIADEAVPILVKGKTYNAEYTYIRKDGQTLWGMVSAKALNPSNLDDGVVFIINDITERKRIENKLNKLNKKLEQQATTDHLTGIFNRRYLTQLLHSEINRAIRYRQSFSVILIDIDHFKNLNDSYGHSAGDKVLEGVAQLLSQGIRQVDTVARWGGEEFLILCPNTRLADAERLAELLRQKLELKTFGQVGKVTASFGVAEHLPSQPLEDLVNAADAALYRAKEKRNCVHTARPPPTH